ncbi:MAG TPA: hypothetical protein VHQ70_11430 [Syntrophomonadaceae bacterium]|nr:hypothetical protein [Syntrophomonadaceae bacterium]
MKNVENGLKTLLCYCIFTALIYFLTPAMNKTTASVVYIVVLLSVLMGWYEIIYIDLRKGLLQGIITMLFFIVPSLGISGAYYLQAMKEGFLRVLYTFFHSPFIYGLNSVINMPLRPVLSIMLPSGVILVLFTFSLIKNIITENNRRRSPYIF